MKRFIILLVLLMVDTCCAMSEAPKKCLPQEACWPKAEEWEALNKQVNGKLVHIQSFLEPCKTDAKSLICHAALKQAENPFFLETRPDATQVTGYLNAWTSAPSQYAIAAECPEDIVAGVNFARKHNIKLVIKGTGHDYLGRSNAPDSLLIWTHKMRDIKMHDSFVGQGSPKETRGIPAVTVGAGARWLEVYKEVINKHGRYVLGGGCTSVGAAGGFTQGGGFGSFSKKFGTGAANMLEAEIVTADGKVLVANEYQNQDLFWALRGGGGGTFGVVTKITYRTHELPHESGSVDGEITASSDQAFKKLLVQFIHFYRENLNNEHWGEQVEIRRDNSLRLNLVFIGLNKADIERKWQSFKEVLAKRPDLFKGEIKITAIPIRKRWDYFFLEQYQKELGSEIIHKDEGQESYWWWAGNQQEVSAFLFSYKSRWLPLKLFQSENAQTLAETLFKASRHWDIDLHINKGQAGASSEALRHGKETSMNAELYNAAMFACLTGGSRSSFQGISGHEPDKAKGEEKAKRMESAIKIIRDATPESGTYANEADYFEPDWQNSFWGTNYPRLLSIKRKYDPDNIFTCHHCVGSELMQPIKKE